MSPQLQGRTAGDKNCRPSFKISDAGILAEEMRGSEDIKPMRPEWILLW